MEKIIDGEAVLSARTGIATNPDGITGENAGRPKCEFTDAQLIEAIEGTYGRWGVIAETLGVSTNTAKKYIKANVEAWDAYETEREKIVDMGERVIVMALKSPDPNIAMSAANSVLRTKKALERGWNGGGMVTEQATTTERQVLTMTDSAGRLVTLSDEKITQIEQLLKGVNEGGE